jgi:benzil reductase ((S)-benzoin forming)
MPKNILITGVSSGIGQGLLNYYLANGDHVYGFSRRSVVLNSERFHFIHLDLAQTDQIAARLAQLLRDINSLDLVILNAGILPPFGDMQDTSLKTINMTMQVNVWSNKIIIDTLLAKIPILKQIVAISSGASSSGSRGWNAYALSKATLNMLISLYATEVEQTHFSAIAPGLVETEMQNYVSNLKATDNYPVLKRLQAARGTADMPTPENAAPKISSTISTGIISIQLQIFRHTKLIIIFSSVKKNHG